MSRLKNYFDIKDENLKWNNKESKLLLKTAVFDVTQQTNVAYSGLQGDYIVLNARDWVIVIPELNDKFLMVKQWRHGAKQLSIEFPGGVIDNGEAPEQAARRELKEETTCTANNLIKLGSINPNPALFSNHVHFFLATDLKFTGTQQLDNDEFINYLEIDKNEVLDLVGTEPFCHALMGTALAFYTKYKKIPI